MPPQSSALAGNSSNSFNDRGDALTATDAERDERGGEIAPFQLIEHAAQQYRASGAERMAERDGAAVHINLLGIDIELAHRLHRHAGEGFVDLPEVDILHTHSRLI